MIEGQMLAPDKYSGSGIIRKGQMQLNLSVLLRIYKIHNVTTNGGDHVVHMLENSVISLRTLLANLNFDMSMNGSSCVFKCILLGSWWVEVYRMAIKHMVRLRAYVNNLSYHMIAIGK